MKLLHTSDWHVGRTLNGYSLQEELEYAFEQIIALAKEEQVDGIIIAGDLYDRSVPNTEAVSSFNRMLRTLNIKEQFPIFMVSGNHDGARRLDFGSEWMKFNKLHLTSLLKDAFQPIIYNNIQFYLLPFFDPMDARVFYRERGVLEEELQSMRSINDALAYVMQDMKSTFDPTMKQILVTHFAVSPSSEAVYDLTSETISKVGGLSTVSSVWFDDFDYVALGHIHTRSAYINEKQRYSGSPIRFNVKEAKRTNDPKGVYLVEVTENEIKTSFHELQSKVKLTVLEEEWETLINPDFYRIKPTYNAWFAITITNYDRAIHAGQNLRAQLEQIYGTVVELDYQMKTETQMTRVQQRNKEISNEELVAEFYKEMTGEELSPFLIQFVENTFVKLGKEV